MEKLLGGCLVGIFLLFTFPVAAKEPVGVLDKTNPAAVSVKAPQGARPALTSGECTSLNGKVLTTDACGSNKNGCYTTDANGKIHMACIDEVKH